MLGLAPGNRTMRFRYRFILLGIVLISLHHFVNLVYAGISAEASGKQFPPYPSVWEYVLAKPRQGVYLMSSPNGDVSIFPHEMVRRIINGERIRTSSGIGFFSREISPLMTSLEMSEAGYQFLQDSLLDGITLSNGMILKAKSESSSAHCGNYLGYYLSIGEEGKEPTKEIRFMYLLEEPEFVESTYCEGGEAHDRTVVSLYFDAIELQDGSLLVTSPWIVLRLNPDLTTKSSLLNARIFLIPRDVDPYQELGVLNDQRTPKTTQEVWMEYLRRIQKASQ